MGIEYLDHRNVQLAEVGILDYFHNFCQKNNLKYSLVAGTLLGAVRHKGFIPWDDDIDVGMPRPDYERFKRLRDQFETERYKLLSDEEGQYPFSKIYDLQISINAKASSDKYLWIDVFPFDGLPDNKKDISWRFSRVAVIRRLFTDLDSSWQEGKLSTKKLIKYLLYIPAKIVGKEGCKKRLISIAKRSDYESSPNVGPVVWGIHGLGEVIPREEFENTVDLDFEGKQYKAMKCWDMNLKGLYGDYMKLPPEDKRACHTIMAYDNSKARQ